MRDPYKIEFEKPVKLIISTDIGSDIDDSLALLEALHLPKSHVDILGLITEFGHVGIRAEVSKKIVNSYNKSHPNRKREFPIFAGDNIPIWTTSKKTPWIWHTGNEGKGCLSLENISKAKKYPYLHNKRSKGAEFLVEKINEFPNEIVLLCIGSLLNVAKSFRIDKKLPNLLKKIVFMGLGTVRAKMYPPRTYEKGKEYYVPHTNHNVRQDFGAAIEVLSSDCEIYFVGHCVTNLFWFENECTKYLRNVKSKYDECNDVGRLLNVWLDYRTKILRRDVNGTCPHDALTLTEAIYPRTFLRYVRGEIVLSPEDEMSFFHTPNGRHFVGICRKRFDYVDSKKNDFVDFLGMILRRNMEEKEVVEYFKGLKMKVEKNEEKHKKEMEEFLQK